MLPTPRQEHSSAGTLCPPTSHTALTSAGWFYVCYTLGGCTMCAHCGFFPCFSLTALGKAQSASLVWSGRREYRNTGMKGSPEMALSHPGPVNASPAPHQPSVPRLPLGQNFCSCAAELAAPQQRTLCEDAETSVIVAVFYSWHLLQLPDNCSTGTAMPTQGS